MDSLASQVECRVQRALLRPPLVRRDLQGYRRPTYTRRGDDRRLAARRRRCRRRRVRSAAQARPRGGRLLQPCRERGAKGAEPALEVDGGGEGVLRVLHRLRKAA